jgi:hypothetical protein
MTAHMFVGFRAAAEYLGVKERTLRDYVFQGVGPRPEPRRRACGSRACVVFTKRELDRWHASRPGQGARTDLLPLVTEFIGYRAAAEYLGITQGSLSGRIATNRGPEPELDRVLVNGQPQAVFLKEELDRWLEETPSIRRKHGHTNRPTTEEQTMLRRTTKTQPTQAKTTDPRAALARALIDAGEVIPSACGTCGATVRADDPEAVQTTRQIGKYPFQRTVRSWRYHGVCYQAMSGPRLLALLLDPVARPLRVTQAHADVTQQLGAPLAYQELEKASSTDMGRGRSPFEHVKRPELAELRAAVDQRHRELTVPVPHASGWPCAVCGRSHELVDAWGQHKGRPVCATCSELVQRSQIPGNRPLWQMARDLVLTEARHLLPARADTWPLPLAQDMPGYCKVSAQTPELAPWAYVADLPEAPLTDEERQEARLAELERRLAGVTA